MSTISAIYNPAVEQFQFIETALKSFYVDITAGLELGGREMPFDNFSYGYDLLSGGAIVSTGTWPAHGEIPVSTDQSVVQVVRVPLNPRTDYSLRVWFKNFGQHYEATHNFTSPIPEAPYASWTWDGNEWQPPTPMPADGKAYWWDESLLSWEEMPV